MKLHVGMFLALVLIFSTANAAYFYPDYATWRGSGKAERAGFAAGLFEGLIATGFDGNGEALAAGLTACSLRLKLGSGMIADAITNHYENNPKAWGKPARQVFWEQFVLGACLEQVNTERSKRSLAPWGGTSD